jgi:hypothetical protein
MLLLPSPLGLSSALQEMRLRDDLHDGLLAVLDVR